MPKRSVRTPCVHGHWGNPWKRVELDRTPEKVRQRLKEKLLTRGVPAWLYLPVVEGDPGVFACTCIKDTNQVSDRPCHACYGTGFVPGYEKFLHETVHFSSAEHSSYTLSSCAIDLKIKPNRILMSSGATSATIETQDKAFDNPGDDDWEVSIAAFIRDTGNTVTAEFSTDNGGTWFSTTLINGVNKPTGTGVIRFRVTMTRTLATDKSPAFEVLRARHVNSNDYNAAEITAVRGNVAVGQILVLRPWVIEQAQTDTGRGIDIEWLGDRSWTMPLDFFDTTITAETPPARVDDRNPGPHPFYEYVAGIKTGERLPITNIKWNEEFGVFTHQSFDDRRAQDNEDPYDLVF